MPRKIADGKPVDASGERLRAIRLELDPETHRRFRVEAAKLDRSMAAMAKELVERFVNEAK